jgi:hypothetical protein
VHHDGSVSLHTRSNKYGKLVSGQLLCVPQVGFKILFCPIISSSSSSFSSFRFAHGLLTLIYLALGLAGVDQTVQAAFS